MTHICLANTTKQKFHFFYRVPERPKLFDMIVPIGGQARVPVDLEGAELQSVIAQLETHGAVREDALKRAKGFVGITYSLEKPVRAESIEAAVEHNDGVLEERGNQMRIEAAVAQHTTVAIAAAEAGVEVKESSIEIVEQTKRGETGGLKQKVEIKGEAPTPRGGRGRGGGKK